MTVIAIGIAGYLAVVAFAISLLIAAKRGDEAMSRVEVLPEHASLGRVAAEIRDAIGVDRVAVIVSDPVDRPDGVVGACAGAPGLLGNRVPIEPTASSGSLWPSEAVALGLSARAGGGPRWCYAHVPLVGTDGMLGAVSVATRRPLPLSPPEIAAIERLARSGDRRFDRRRSARTPGAAA